MCEIRTIEHLKVKFLFLYFEILYLIDFFNFKISFIFVKKKHVNNRY